ncbi:MAG: sulfurtransferase TusA [Hahellaceae bacterium]|nr:sulfurtransferase TusA [Hahellaceae bacterium]
MKNFDAVLDSSGLYCPEPIMLLHNVIRDIGTGHVVKVIATDPSTKRDIPKFCGFLGHELLSTDYNDNDGVFVYYVQKK